MGSRWAESVPGELGVNLNSEGSHSVLEGNQPLGMREAVAGPEIYGVLIREL